MPRCDSHNPPDEQLVTDILVAIDQALGDNGREPMDTDGPTVDSLRWALQRELQPLEVELSRLRMALLSVAAFSKHPHPAPCGTDSCVLCLIESACAEALGDSA